MSTKITHYSCLCHPHQDQDQVCFCSQNWLPNRTEAEGDETTREIVKKNKKKLNKSPVKFLRVAT